MDEEYADEEYEYLDEEDADEEYEYIDEESGEYGEEYTDGDDNVDDGIGNGTEYDENNGFDGDDTAGEVEEPDESDLSKGNETGAGSDADLAEADTDADPEERRRVQVYCRREDRRKSQRLQTRPEDRG